MLIHRTAPWFQKLLLFVTALLLVSCAPRRTSGLVAPPPPSRSSPAAMRQFAMEAWNDREDPDRLLEALLLYKRIHQAEPNDREALVKLARGLCLLADEHLTRHDERLDRYDQGTYFGEKALALNRIIKSRIDAGEDMASASVALGPDDIQAAYWTAMNLERWAGLQGTRALAQHRTTVQGLLEQVASLDEGFDFGGPSRGLALYLASAPRFAGGDLAKSRREFEKALKIAPDYFATRVAMAEFYAPQVRDRALFRRLLRQVIDGNPSLLTEVVPEQRLQQERARRLLARERELFTR